MEVGEHDRWVDCERRDWQEGRSDREQCDGHLMRLAGGDGGRLMIGEEGPGPYFVVACRVRARGHAHALSHALAPYAQRRPAPL